MDSQDWLVATFATLGGLVLREGLAWCVAIGKGNREAKKLELEHDLEKIETQARLQREADKHVHELVKSEYSVTIADLREQLDQLAKRFDLKDTAHLACEQKCSRLEAQLEFATGNIKRLEDRVVELERKDRFKQMEFPQ